jgi:hypothetical protein
LSAISILPISSVDQLLANLSERIVMFLETMPTFQQHWQNQGDLSAFQTRVRSLLNLPESGDNG